MHYHTWDLETTRHENLFLKVLRPPPLSIIPAFIAAIQEPMSLILHTL